MNKVIAREYVENNYVHKDKIREKIKELEEIHKYKYDNYMGYHFDSREQQDIRKKISVLQELLEETNEN